ncbi:MAG: DNA mismatch repair protein MutS [Desulfobulbaceae bacterium S5133MH15]|nr:MAG: DNA mismatch repair protein MutS [Desulfobulbaceae bacterium S5133MH15]
MKTKLTPMLQQYFEIKEQHEDAILFYRMGDFYEMFFEDAVEASKILGITLTSRNKKSDSLQVPMCGIPYHALQTYLAKLVRGGRRVAICEQTEDPAQAKGIVKREVVRIISPGVVTDDHLLDDKSNNYICSVVARETGEKSNWGVSFLDLSTGEFLVGEFPTDNQDFENVIDQITRLTPAEILVSSDKNSSLDALLRSVSSLLPDIRITDRETDVFQFSSARDLLLDHFKTITLDGFGCAHFSIGIIGAGVLLEYVQETQKSSIDHIEKLTPLDLETILQIDDSSRRNLELTQTIIGGSRQGSLLSVIDQTCTPMGARLLKSNLLFPLQDTKRINDRLDAVTFFYKNSGLRSDLRSLLDTVYDLERLNSRMMLGTGNARDILAMKNSLAQLPPIYSLLSQCNTVKLIDLYQQFDILADLYDLLHRSIAPNPPITVREGHLILEGYNSELDELILILRDGKQMILNLESRERESTGISKLKIGYNKVFGYFIEVSKIQAAKVPESYIRKQTLVNAERFITPELKEFEGKVLGAQDRRVELEYQLFLDIRTRLAKSSSRILKTAKLLAQVDFLSANAETAQLYNYRRPQIDTEDDIEIIEGRHPVIERSLPSGKFVPNDILLNQSSDEVLIITGPNMAGKSTVLRQTALIVLLAQMGSYVPAEKAKIGVVDRIFTRVGAMDDLRRGQSTFMVEMSETANILNNATPKSLVVLDEIGRGTSTYDGLAIAWAVAEELVNKNKKGVKTLFATHYHELIELAKSHKRVKNYSITVREWQDTIIFLHKLAKGGTSRSYGIQVAGLAGVPDHVVKRAEKILQDIEKENLNQPETSTKSYRRRKKKHHPNQLSLFPTPVNPHLDYLNNIDLDEITPRQALEILYKMKTI